VFQLVNGYSSETAIVSVTPTSLDDEQQQQQQQEVEDESRASGDKQVDKSVQTVTDTGHTKTD